MNGQFERTFQPQFRIEITGPEYVPLLNTSLIFLGSKSRQNTDRIVTRDNRTTSNITGFTCIHQYLQYHRYLHFASRISREEFVWSTTERMTIAGIGLKSFLG